MKTKILTLITGVVLLFVGCSKDIESDSNDTQLRQLKATAAINAGTIYQTIDDIGRTSVWSGTFSDADANACFRNGNSNQLGVCLEFVRA